MKETFFPLQFIDLNIIWLAQRYTIINYVEFWELHVENH